jgi:hypothetical protein
MAQFRKKPVVIEAVQWDGSNVSEIREFFGGFLEWGFRDTEFLLIANPKDWIIKGIKGEFYPCKPDIFEATYEPVSQEARPAEEPHQGREKL